MEENMSFNRYNHSFYNGDRTEGGYFGHRQSIPQNSSNMSRHEIIDTIKKIDFGDIDGLFDPNLDKYFFDEDFWEKIVDSNVYYVIGRKGTGKSALYQWIYKNQGKHNIQVANLSFQDFPFEKLLKLQDDNYSRPNQYQSIWKNIILNEICKMIISDQSNTPTDTWTSIKNYLDFRYGQDLRDLYKQTTQKVQKSSAGLVYNGFNLGYSAQDCASYDVSSDNITDINRALEAKISDYLKNSSSLKYVIQFDQLDDNYNKYVDNGLYFQCIISLFKVIYNLSQSFRRDGIPLKIIGYLRSDIFYQINQYDAESARWEQYKYTINWAIINRNDWDNARLLQLINKRIKASVDIGHDNPFSILFSNRITGLGNDRNQSYYSLFRFIIHRSFHRPRDIIQFCIKIKEQICLHDDISRDQIENAEKEYSLWFLSEIENEIGPRIANTALLYEFLRELGQGDYSVSDFKQKYARFSGDLKMKPDELLDFLYDIGIILNVNYMGNGRNREIYSIVRNDRSMFNRDLRIMTHSGVYKGIYVSKFQKSGRGYL